MILLSRSCVALLVTSLIGGGWCDDAYTIKHSRDGYEYQELTPPIINPQSPELQYSTIKLKNNLRAVILSMPDATNSAAALSVQVGSQSDPNIMPGMAHFYEHMMFMGSKKYPNSTEYLTYMAANSGHPGATTMYDRTKYIVRVSHQGFEGALDRFSSVIEAPLFSEETIVSEAKNVNNEFNNHFTDTRRKLTQVQRLTADPNHPYSRDFIGSYESLVETPRAQGINIRQELVKFKDAYYSANIMHLVVVSNKSVEELRELVVSKFSGIPDQNITVPTHPGSPFRPQDKGVIINAVTNSNNNFLDIQFDIPSQFKYSNELPIQYIKYVLGSKGPGSLKSILTKKNWITSFNFGEDSYYCEFSEFALQFNLTPLGIEHQEDLIKLLFQAISVIKKHGVTQERFNELHTIGEIKTKYLETMGSLGHMHFLSDAMVYLKSLSMILDYSEYPKVYNATVIKEFMSSINPRNMRVSFMSKVNAGIPQLTSEPWYSTMFNVKPLSEDLIANLEKIVNDQGRDTGSQFELPELNRLMPTSFTLIAQDLPPGYPKIVKNYTSGQLWYGVEAKPTPKATIKINYNFQLNNYTALAYCAQLKIIVKVLELELTDLISETDTAGVRIYFSVDRSGLDVHIYGFSQHLVEITKLVIDKLRNLEFSDERVRVSKQQLIDQNSVQKLSSLYHDFNRLLNAVMVKGEVKEEAELFFAEITKENIQETTHQLLTESYVTVFISGNIDLDDSEKIAAYAQNNSASSEFHPTAKEAVVLPDGSNFVVKYLDQYAERQNSYTVSFFYLSSGADYQSMAYAYFISYIMRPALFNQLRTVESLGYRVQAKMVRVGDGYGITALVEGAARDSLYVEHRINAFLNEFIRTIEKMTPKEFQNQIDAFILQHKTMHSDIRGLNGYLWDAILSKERDFSMKDKVNEELEHLKKSNLLEILKSTFREGSPNRRKVSFHLVAKRAESAYIKSSNDPSLSPGVYIDNILKWKGDILSA